LIKHLIIQKLKIPLPYLMPQTISINRQKIKITHPDKLMFPGQKISKWDLAKYYQRVAEFILPFTRDRTLTLHRFPNGIEGKSFYQKKAAKYFPRWIERVDIPVKEKDNRKQTQIVCQNVETLVYLANQAVITPHIWLSKIDDLQKPDKLIFDLDPSGGDFGQVRQAGLAIKSELDKRSVPSVVMTTGSKGAHVLVPLKPGASFDKVRAYAKDLADELAEAQPNKFTTEISKDKRGGRIFLDYLRNSFGQNSVTPYSLRARQGAPVATPLTWEEFEDGNLNSQTFNYQNIFKRLEKSPEPWGEWDQRAVKLPA
jgi:bifunctional non-homologous end joining protein LigD